MRALVAINLSDRHCTGFLIATSSKWNLFSPISNVTLPTARDWYGHVTRVNGNGTGMVWRYTHLLLFLSRSFLCLGLSSQSLFLQFLPVDKRQQIIHRAVINLSCVCKRLLLLLYRLMRLQKNAKLVTFHHTWNHRKAQEYFTRLKRFRVWVICVVSDHITKTGIQVIIPLVILRDWPKLGVGRSIWKCGG